MRKLKIMDVSFDNIDLAQAAQTVGEILQQGTDAPSFKIYTPNPEILMKARSDKNYQNVLNRGDMVVADGVGIVIAGKIKKTPLKSRVTGVDLLAEILKAAAAQEKTVYLLGGRPGIAKMAAENIKSIFPGIVIAGYRDGYYSTEDEESVVQSISAANPDVLVVGLGAPKQEFFIDRYADDIGAKTAIGIGGALDIFAGTKKRAPKFISRIGMEWLYRVIAEPSRIPRLAAIPKFLWHIIFTK